MSTHQFKEAVQHAHSPTHEEWRKTRYAEALRPLPRPPLPEPSDVVTPEERREVLAYAAWYAAQGGYEEVFQRMLFSGGYGLDKRRCKIRGGGS